MAAPSYVSSLGGVGTASPVAATLPGSIVQNDIIVLAVEDDRGADVVASGWTEFTSSPQNATADTQLTCLWRRYQTGDGNASITGFSNHALWRTIAIRGCSTTGDPYDVTSGYNNGGVASASIVIPGATTTVAECLILAITADGVDASGGRVTDGTWANADLTNITDRVDFGTTTGNGGGLAAATGEKAAAGAYGNTTATYVSSRRHGAMTIAFKPPLPDAIPPRKIQTPEQLVAVYFPNRW